MDHGPMVSSGVGHRARRRLSRDSPEPLLPRRRPFDSPSSRSMDLASIRARRARLEALTASIRLPPLVPSDVLPSSPSAARMSPLSFSRTMMLPETPLRRITWGDRPLTGMSSPEPRLPPTLPRMAKLILIGSTPHHPLPSIGHTREALGDLPFTPEEEEEEEQRAAGEPWEDGVKDGEAGGGDSQDMTHGEHPQYPPLHDPLAPLPAPNRPSSYPSPSPPAQASSPQLSSPPLQLSTPVQSSPSSELSPQHSSSPPVEPFTFPSSHSPLASPPPHSSPPPLPQPSPSPHFSPPPQLSPPLQQSSHSPKPPSPLSSPPPQPSSSPPASPTQDRPPSQPSSPAPPSPLLPQSPSLPLLAPTEESPPTNSSPPAPEESPPTQPSPHPPTSPTEAFPASQLSFPPRSSPSMPTEEASPLTQPSSPPRSPQSNPSSHTTNAPSSTQPLKPSTAPSLSSPPSPTQAPSRPNTSPPELFAPTTLTSPLLKEATQPTKSPSSAPHVLSSAPEVEGQAKAASESLSFESFRKPKPLDPREFEALVTKMSSSDNATRAAATVRVRQLLSASHNAPIDEMLQLDVLTPALNNLHDNNPAIQYETVWIITNIVSGTTQQTQAVADKGFIPVLVQLVASGEPWVREQAAWALGNMAADSTHLRNEIVEAGALRPLVDLTKPQAKVSSLHKVVWALSNIFKLKNLSASPEDLTYVLEIFRDNLLVHRDEEVVADTLWTLTYLTDAGGSEAIQQVVEADLLPLLVTHMSSRSRQVVYPAIRTLGTILSGTDLQTQAALEAGMLPPLHTILKEARETRRTKEATWALSNITAGTVEQIQKVVDEGFLLTLVHLIQKDIVEVSREAVWAVSNLVAGGSSEQVAALVKAGGGSALLTTLQPHAPHRLDLITVDTLLTIMEKTGGEVAVQDLEEAGGVEILKGKLTHEDEEVVERVREILETYFPDAISKDEKEEDDEKSDEIEEAKLG